MRDEEIREREERVEQIIETLESGDPSLAEARDLREEAEELLAELEAALEAGDGEVEEL